MIRLAHIKDGYIVNVSLHKASEPLPADTMLESEAIAAGYERITAPVDAATLYPPAEMWQIKVWLSRNGINPATVPQLISSITPDGPERWEALARWESVTKVPMDHPMVQLLWQHLSAGLTPQRTLEEAWLEILAI